MNARAIAAAWYRGTMRAIYGAIAARCCKRDGKYWYGKWQGICEPGLRHTSNFRDRSDERESAWNFRSLSRSREMNYYRHMIPYSQATFEKYTPSPRLYLYNGAISLRFSSADDIPSQHQIPANFLQNRFTQNMFRAPKRRNLLLFSKFLLLRLTIFLQSQISRVCTLTWKDYTRDRAANKALLPSINARWRAIALLYTLPGIRYRFATRCREHTFPR